MENWHDPSAGDTSCMDMAIHQLGLVEAEKDREAFQKAGHERQALQVSIWGLERGRSYVRKSVFQTHRY